MPRPKLHVVHCVDTEGPLEETLEATFERIESRFGLSLLPSRSTLANLQNGTMDLGPFGLAGEEAEVAKFIAPERIDYLTGWAEVETMIRRVTSPEVRNALASPKGTPHLFSWLVIDIVGYVDNPRRKAAGFHAVYDRFATMLRDNAFDDCMGWHFHTVPVGGHALQYNTCWTNNDFHEQALVRRLLERDAFPGVFRAGACIERDDLSHWLERHIPFDYSSCALPDFPYRGYKDWRGAPVTWGAYHPDFSDYRRSGQMKRSIFRCLPVNDSEMPLGEEDVRLAFSQAETNGHAILAFSTHDRRDMQPDMELATRLIRETAKSHPEVEWDWANALTAAREHLGLDDTPLELSARLDGDTIIATSSRPIFGPAPFLGVEEFGGIFHRDNMTREGESEWSYRVNRPQRTRRVGIGASAPNGATATAHVAISGDRP